MTASLPMSETNVTFRIGRHLAATLDRSRGQHSRALRAKYDLVAYYRVLAEELEQTGLSDLELDALARVTTIPTPNDPTPERQLLVDALRGLGPDHPLAVRLCRLSPAQQLAVAHELAQRRQAGIAHSSRI